MSSHRHHKPSIDPIEIEKSLRGIQYPTDKQGLLERAEKNKSSEQVLQVLEKFSNRSYLSYIDVSTEILKVESMLTETIAE